MLTFGKIIAVVGALCLLWMFCYAVLMWRAIRLFLCGNVVREDGYAYPPEVEDEDNEKYMEDKYSIKDLHPDHPDNI